VLSLNARLMLSASLVLVAFLGLTGLALERAFQQAGLAAVQDRLQGQVYTLLAAAEMDAGQGLVMPLALPDARLSSPDSGLYARVVEGAGDVLWHSPSLLGIEIPFPIPEADGVAAFAPIRAGDGRELYGLSFSVQWELGAGGARRLAFQVAESRDILGSQLGHFRRSLWGWLGAAALALILVQGLVLRFGLAPLRRVAVELADIETGARQSLSSGFPRELRTLTERLNAFIDTSRNRMDRSRNALAELAHSLKTPLAVLRGLVDGDPDRDQVRDTLAEQTTRMHRTIDYQLQKAAASGPTPLAPPVDVGHLAHRLRDSMLKVYGHKSLAVDMEIPRDAVFRGDEGDLMELLGNLMDNGCKWARQRVLVRIGATEDGTGLSIEVHDDGPGIPADQAGAVLGRGVRGDASTPGHGIGLAVVRDIVVEAYGGEVRIGASDLGGAALIVSIPFP
jgi:two-component system sensor histidine kinase PhoQ